MKRAFGIAFLFVVLAGVASANEAIWREGEDVAATTTFNGIWIQNDTNIDFTLLSPGMPGGATGKWVGHYATSNSPAYWQTTLAVAEGGTYTWWARIAAVNSSYTYSVDGAAAQNVDMSHQHELIDLVRPAYINNVEMVAWVRIGSFALAPGAHTARLTAVYNAGYGGTIGGVDCVCFVNYPWTPTGALRPTGTTNPDPTPGATVWFPLHVAEDAFSANSIIDMRSVIDAATGIPAGKYGHLTRVQDHFELSGHAGTPVKLWGLTANHPSSIVGTVNIPYTNIFTQQAHFYSKHGVNLVRRHPMFEEIGQSQDPVLLDVYDQWFKALKDNGIYTNWSVFYPDNTNDGVSKAFVPAPDAAFAAVLTGAGVTMDQLWNELPAGGAANTKKLGGMDNFVRPYQQGQWNWEMALLQHTNPYTGLQYVNDPALAIIEVQNEDCLFWWWPLSDLAAGTTYPNHTKLLRYMWFQWLGTRYASDAALKTAWGSGWITGDSVVTFNPNMKIYDPWALDSTTSAVPTEKARAGDFVRFLAETQRATYQTRFDNLRALGYQGVQVSTGWMSGGPGAAAANTWADDAGDAIDRHSYMGGSIGGWYVATGTVYNDIQLSNPAGYVFGARMVGTGAHDTAPYESLYQVEDKPAIATEWDDSPPTLWRAEITPLFAFYGMGLQGWDASLNFAGSYAWMETGWPGPYFGPGMYVAETPLYMAQYPALALAVYRGDIQQGDSVAARRMSVDDLFRGVDPLSQNLPNGGYSGMQNMYTPGEVNAIGRVTMKADASLSSASSTKVDWTSYWNQTNKIVTSTAGGGTLHQLVWDYNNRVVQVKSPKTQAIIGWAGGNPTYNLGDVQVTVTTPFVDLIFTSLDGLPLSSSASILITALAQDTEVGALYGGAGTSLTAIGGPPLLLQPVQAGITMGGLPVSSVKVVDVYGVPTNVTVPVSANAFTIDGNYATYYYQVKRNQTPEPNIALSTNALTPSCVQGSSPVDDSFQAWNSGNAPLNYTVSKDQSWLTISPPGGSSTDDSQKVTHTVTYHTTGLTAGSYNATITVTDPNATNNPQTISVTLTVRTPSVIVSDTTVLNPVVTVGGTAITQQFKIWDGGEMPLTYIVSDDALWLSANPAISSSTGVGDKKTHSVSYTTSALAVGTYNATITITAPEAANNPLTIAVHLTVQAPPPLIARSPTLLSPTAVHGADAVDGSFQVWNSVTGGSPLSYTITKDTAWLAVSPGTDSSTDPSDHKTHTVTYSTSALGLGTYNGTITITAAGVANSPQTIAVQLTVTAAPAAIARTPATLSPFCAVSTNALAQTFQVWNSSDQTLSYSISDGGVPWLSEGPDTGTSTGTADKQTHTITYSTSGLALGTYDATITITDAAASNNPQTIAVHLSVLSTLPAISANAASFTPSCLKGQNAADQSVDIWNSGGGTLDYSAFVSTTDGPPGWVAVSPGTASSTGVGNKQTHGIVYTTAAMAVGTYHASLVITSEGASNTPQSIPVTLTITATGAIGTDTASLSASAGLGASPADQAINVWNAGTGTMAYTITGDAPWLVISPTSGSSTGVGDQHAHTVSYGSYLGLGTHNATITITGAGITNAPVTIPVQFDVTTPPAIQITSPQNLLVLTDPIITVTGTVGVPGSFQAIWVNGVLATSTGPGFSTWQASIPMDQIFEGGWFNWIGVTTLDNAGVYNPNAAALSLSGVGPVGLTHKTGMAMTANGAVVPGDVDTFQFEAAAGSSVTLTAKGVGKPAPSLKLDLYDNYDHQMLTRTGGSISVTSPLPGNGRYMVRLSAASGDGGRYTLTLAGKAPIMKWTQTGSIPTQMSVFDHTMAMPKGTLLTASVSSTKFQPTLQVLDPLGHAMPLGGFITTATGKVTVKNLPMPSGMLDYLPGNYVLRMGSGDGRVGSFTLTCAGLAPAAVPDLVNYPLILGTSPKSSVHEGAQLQISVSGYDVGETNALLDLGGGLNYYLPLNSTSITNGKGSIYVTVPYLPAGPYKLYLQDWLSMEDSNIVTIQLLP